MIRLRGQLRCMTDAEAAAVRAHVHDHIRLTRAEPACLSFDITETDDPLVFEVMEAFRDRAGFDAHQARTRESPWFTATRGILRDFRIEEVGD
jgi:quinol monooxygenase YgiN